MNHLTPDELIDAVERSLSPARQAHLTECARCGLEVTQLSTILDDSRAAAEVPEPSPLFWDHLSNRVRTAIAAEPMAPRTGRWFQWPILAPVAGLVLLVFALVSAVPQVTVIGPTTEDAGQRGAPSGAVASIGVDESWEVVSELVGELDIETAQQAGIAIGLGSAEDIVAQLTSAEQQELVRLLQAELQRAGG